MLAPLQYYTGNVVDQWLSPIDKLRVDAPALLTPNNRFHTPHHRRRIQTADSAILPQLSRQDFIDDAAVHIRQAEIAAAIPIRQLFVIKAEQM